MPANSDACSDPCRTAHVLMLWSCYRRCTQGILQLLQSPCAALQELRLYSVVITADGAAQLATAARQLRVLHMER